MRRDLSVFDGAKPGKIFLGKGVGSLQETGVAPENEQEDVRKNSLSRGDRRVRIEIGGLQFELELYDNGAAKALAAGLPQKLSLSRWGGEYYGSLGTRIPAKGEHRDLYEPGEVALWPPGNAFCIFFGPTPASTDDRPRMASPGVPLGRIHGDLAELEKLGAGVSAVLTNGPQDSR